MTIPRIFGWCGVAVLVLCLVGVLFDMWRTIRRMH